jgi:hypothetical protein
MNASRSFVRPFAVAASVLAVLVSVSCVALAGDGSASDAIRAAFSQAFGYPISARSPADGEVLTFDSATGTWVASAAAGGFANPATASLDMDGNDITGVGDITADGNVVFSAPASAVAQGRSISIEAGAGSAGNSGGNIILTAGDSAFPADGAAISLGGGSAGGPGGAVQITGDSLNVLVSTLTTSGTLAGSNLQRGSGSPESSVTGSIGDVYQRTDGSTGTTLYVKESGSATNTGWVAHGAGGASGWSQALRASYGMAPIGGAASAGFLTINGRSGFVFDSTTLEALDFEVTVPESYSSSSVITVEIDWVSRDTDASPETGGATSGAVVWDVAVERMADGSLDLDSTGFDAAKSDTAGTTVSATSGLITTTTITLTQAEADDVTAGDLIVLRVRRDTADGEDTMTGDAMLLAVRLKQ